MVNTYYYQGDISVESVNNLIEVLNGFEGSVDLWFSSCGGHPSSMRFLISYLNSRKDEIKITLTDEICSAATLLLIDFEGVLEYNDLDFILFHMFDRERYPLRQSGSVSDNKLQKQDLKGNIEMVLKFREKNILTKEQSRKFLKGKDVVLYEKEIRKLWKTSEQVI